tara:strand:- start:2500 stop:2943 length:444 start_codon:yes stop_codon:yes gene_type:complete
MAEYRRRSDGLLVEGDHELRAASPNVSFPSDLKESTLNALGWDVVQETPQPTTTVYQQVVRNGVVKDSLKRWKQQYEIHELNKEDIDRLVGSDVRDERNELLKETDWTQNRDVTLSNDAEWKTYRENLRNLPTQSGFPHNVVWPTKP